MLFPHDHTDYDAIDRKRIGEMSISLRPLMRLYALLSEPGMDQASRAGK
jgi:hypothetical protein